MSLEFWSWRERMPKINKEKKRIRRVTGKFRRMYYIKDLQSDRIVAAYPSVTTVTGLEEKPALKKWFAKMAVIHLQKKMLAAVNNPFIDARTALKGLVVDDVINEAIARPDTIKDEAANKGKRVHKIIEKFFKGEEIHPGGDIKLQIDNFFEWARKTKVIPIASEKMVYSKKYKYAGTLDLVAQVTIDSVPAHYVIDFKTSNGIWLSHKLQLAAYLIAYEEMTKERMNAGAILRIDKNSGDIEWHEFSLDELLDYFEEFKRLCEIWHIRDKRRAR